MAETHGAETIIDRTDGYGHPPNGTFEGRFQMGDGPYEGISYEDAFFNPEEFIPPTNTLNEPVDTLIERGHNALLPFDYRGYSDSWPSNPPTQEQVDSAAVMFADGWYEAFDNGDGAYWRLISKPANITSVFIPFTDMLINNSFQPTKLVTYRGITAMKLEKGEDWVLSFSHLMPFARTISNTPDTDRIEILVHRIAPVQEGYPIELVLDYTEDRQVEIPDIAAPFDDLTIYTDAGQDLVGDLAIGVSAIFAVENITLGSHGLLRGWMRQNNENENSLYIVAIELRYATCIASVDPNPILPYNT